MGRANFDDQDDDLPIEIVHNCRWFNAADNDDAFMEANFLFYRFAGHDEDVVVPVDLSDPFAATVMNPEYDCDISARVMAYLRKRFEHVKQATGSGYQILWNGWP